MYVVDTPSGQLPNVRLFIQNVKPSIGEIASSFDEVSEGGGKLKC